MREKHASPERRFQQELAFVTDALRALAASLENSPDAGSAAAPGMASPGVQLYQLHDSLVVDKRSRGLPLSEADVESTSALEEALRMPSLPRRRLSGGAIAWLRGLGLKLLSSRTNGVARAAGEHLAEHEPQPSRPESPEDSWTFISAAFGRLPHRDLVSTVVLPVPGSPEDSNRIASALSAEFWSELTRATSSGLVIHGRYNVENLLWEGPMSRVYRGFDQEKDRPVAVKIVTPPASELVRASLEATEPLSHPGILRVEHFGELGSGGLYLVSPLLGGTTLRELLFARNCALEALLVAFRKACEGVAHAHARGVVHRDLKPANIQVEPDGRTVVIDWGLACRDGRSAASEGSVLGTPLYMAPEQVEGEAVSPRTDVYALGTLLYEILTGTHPAGPAADVSEILYRVRTQTPPPPSALRTDLPPALDEIVMRCLPKVPEKRYSSAADLLEDLDGLGQC